MARSGWTSPVRAGGGRTGDGARGGRPHGARLLLSIHAWDALRHRAGLTGEHPAGYDDALAALERAAVVGDAGLSADLARLVAVSHASLAEVRLARAGHEVRVWIDGESVVALVPRGDELFELAAVQRRFAADLLARLVELGPRAEAPRSAMRVRPGEIALAIANRAAPVGGGLVALIRPE